VVAGSSAPVPDDVATRARAALVEPPQEAGGRIRPLPLAAGRTEDRVGFED
jgi:acyl-CoA thioester hydrolase